MAWVITRMYLPRPLETADSDGDGVGDNADVFPNDAMRHLTRMATASVTMPIQMMIMTGCLTPTNRRTEPIPLLKDTTVTALAMTR